MNATLSIDNQEFTNAVRDFAKLKGKTDEAVVNKAMKYWVPFTSNKLIPTTAAEIRSELTGQAARISRGAKKSMGQLRNSLAAAIIAARLRKRGWKPSKDPAAVADFYFHVQKLVNSRARSSGYLRAGMIPDMKKFGVPLRGTKAMKSKGHSGGYVAKIVGGYTEALSRNAREGAYKKYPNAYHQALGEVAKQFRKFIDQDYNKLADKTGF